jgi:hypothetical protein
MYCEQFPAVLQETNKVLCMVVYFRKSKKIISFAHGGLF